MTHVILYLGSFNNLETRHTTFIHINILACLLTNSLDRTKRWQQDFFLDKLCKFRYVRGHP